MVVFFCLVKNYRGMQMALKVKDPVQLALSKKDFLSETR